MGQKQNITNKDKYYNNHDILNMKDLDDKIPNMLIITSNRSDGKTTSFLLKALDDKMDNDSEVLLLYRHSYELTSCNLLFEGILWLREGYNIKSVRCVSHAKGLFQEIQLEMEEKVYKRLGFAVCLKHADLLKKYSAIFAEINMILFDEYQLENGKYLKNEVECFQSIYTSVSRGGGSQSRDVLAVLLGNDITLMNPWFIYLGIHKRYQPSTRFMRGHGWVAHFHFNPYAADAIRKNAMSRVFENSRYINHTTSCEWLIRSDGFIAKIPPKAKYLFTLKYDNKSFGVRRGASYTMHISKKWDKTCKTEVALCDADHTPTTILLQSNFYMMSLIRDCYQNGRLFFEDLECKEIIYDLLGIDVMLN